MACIPSFGILTDFKERKIGIFCQLLLIKFVQRCIKKKLCVFHHLETIDEVGGEGGCSCFSRQEEMQTMESLNIIQTVGKNVIKDSTLSHRQQHATVNTSKGKKGHPPYPPIGLL